MIVEPTKKISAGKHQGRIEKIEEVVRGGYKYTDLWLKIEGDGVEARLKCSVPSRIEENSALGRIIRSTGRVLIVGEDLDLHEILEGQLFDFETIEKKGTGKHEGKTFLEIMPDSVRMATEQMD